MYLFVVAAIVAVTIDDGGVIPTLGQSYNLTCTAFGTTFTSYQWRKDGSVISTEQMVTFSPLRLTDAGSYSCGNGTLFSNDTVVTLQGALTGCSE